MPIKSCRVTKTKKGFKFGKSGKCYPSKKKAIKQMRAIEFNRKHWGTPNWGKE